jgi:hypothetical protein
MKYILLFIALGFFSSVTAQSNLLLKEKGKYFYNEKEYKCEELGDVYINYPESLITYISGRRNKRAANVVAITGVPFLIGGAIGLASDDIGGVIFGAFSFVSGGLLTIISLIPRGIGNAKLQKARKMFNYEMIERHGYREDTSLSIGVTPNGVGLVYQF